MFTAFCAAPGCKSRCDLACAATDPTVPDELRARGWKVGADAKHYCPVHPAPVVEDLPRAIPEKDDEDS